MKRNEKTRQSLRAAKEEQARAPPLARKSPTELANDASSNIPATKRRRRQYKTKDSTAPKTPEPCVTKESSATSQLDAGEAVSADSGIT